MEQNNDVITSVYIHPSVYFRYEIERYKRKIHKQEGFLNIEQFWLVVIGFLLMVLNYHYAVADRTIGEALLLQGLLMLLSGLCGFGVYANYRLNVEISESRDYLGKLESAAESWRLGQNGGGGDNSEQARDDKVRTGSEDGRGTT